MNTEFRYPANIQSITAIRADLQKLATQWKLPASELKQLIMIIEELFSNIARFAFEDPGDHFVELALFREEAYIRIEIRDGGKAFNPLEYSTKEPDDPVDVRNGGMGLTLVRAISESMDYKRIEEKNILTIRKSIFY